ncbi:MAG: hypothetical protein LQ351_003046 [Letrouitia transgressa]|nr:MAG: hypothetical protein LQ351_003046 [Letrouitia transgressa]
MTNGTCLKYRTMETAKSQCNPILKTVLEALALPKPAALTWGGWTTAGEGTGVKITVKKMGSLEASVLSEGLLEREIKKDEMSSGGSLFVDLA